MKFITFEFGGLEQVGVLSSCESFVYPISAFGLGYPSMNALIEGITAEERQLLQTGSSAGCAEKLSLCEVKLCAPIPVPRQDVICLGENYMEHAEESYRYQNATFHGEQPNAVYFGKRVNRAYTDGDPLRAHSDFTERLDYEAELAVVIGRDATCVSEKDAASYIFGYMTANDVSARDVQYRHKQSYFGKSLEGFTIMGPSITTADEISFPPILKVSTYVNGEQRQNSDTGKLIFGIAHIISELSHGFTLKAGSILFTGTPAGVGMGFQPPRFLKPGDLVECSVEKLGTLTNRVEY